ncbi:hypothetical protein INT47_000131 [Mucor saturninus]|uniref:Nucleoprotein TPR n=1 Tax=Mucor saturninus TaxID=64648 RepID=A0A8H7RH18_9FUNG|nr:hypothetical protein INT47_000131 [Mucor saturninus]
MSTTSEDAIGLKKALEFDKLQQQIVDLQSNFKEVSEKNLSLQSEADKCKSELESLKSLKAATELEKQQLDDKLQLLVKNENVLRHLNAQSLEQLNEKREALRTVQDKLAHLQQELAAKDCETQELNTQLLRLKDTRHNLDRKLSVTINQKAQLDTTLRSLQQDHEQYRHQSIKERRELEEKLVTLEREKDTASDSTREVLFEKRQLEEQILTISKKLTTAVQERDNAKLSLQATSRSYQELSALYEEHVTHTQEKTSTYEATISSIAGERDALQLKITELEATLKQEQELRKEHFEKLTGAATSSNNTQSASHLLNLMRDYEKLNRHPADIYDDFFRLKADYEKAVASSTQATNTVETMTRQLNEKENLFNRLHRELVESKRNNDSTNTLLKKEQDANKNALNENKQLKNQLNEMKEERDSLKSTLTSTTYQLQYLLSDVQRRNEPIPAELKNSADLLGSAQVNPELPHEQLIFKDVASLQDLNKNLTCEVMTLKQELQKKTKEMTRDNTQKNIDVKSYKTALDEARQTVMDLSTQHTNLENRLGIIQKECQNYKNLVSQIGNGDANDHFEQMKQIQCRQNEEKDVAVQDYTKEVRVEVAGLSKELEAARESATEAKYECSRLKSELDQAGKIQASLKSSIDNLRNERLNLINQKSDLQEYSSNRDSEFEITKGKLRDLEYKVHDLDKEKIFLESRLESATTAYNTMKDAVNTESASKVHMTHLLEAINNRMEVFNESSKENAEQNKETIEHLNRELQHARDTLAIAEKELDNYKSIDQQEIQDKYKESVIEVRLLKEKIADVEQQLSKVNQDRIIAQTKLAAAEEQIQNLSTSDSPTAGESSSCNDHIHSLASAEDRIRVLEHDIETYHTVIENNEKRIEELSKEHTDYITNTQVHIDKLVKELEIKTAAVGVVQAEADKNVAEYKVMHEKVLSTQSELIKEKRELEAKVDALDTENLNKDNDLKALRQALEEKDAAYSSAETKLDAQTKATEEYRQTIQTLRADVSNLSNEIVEYKAKADASTATIETVNAEYKREAAQWTEFEKSLKKSLLDSEKQREALAARVEELVKKHAEWQASIENNGNVDSTAFEGTAQETLKQLREATITLRIEKDANESKYRYERELRERAQSELLPLKQQFINVSAELQELREQNKNSSANVNTSIQQYIVQCNAFQAQNLAYFQENTALKQQKEQALSELQKKQEEISPLLSEIGALKGQLDVAQNEIEILNKSQKEWSARSAQLLSKYNKVDPAESERIKTELSKTKSELEEFKTEKVALEEKIKELEALKAKTELERGSLISKANERGRLAMEWKKKFNEVSTNLKEHKTKLEECEQKLKVAETAIVTANNQNASNKEKEDIDEEKKKLEESLKSKTDDYLTLEKKYNNILIRARSLQQERAKSNEEVKTLRLSQAELKTKITTLEGELEVARSTLQANSVELTRLKAQNSMALNKNTRMQKELDALKIPKASALSAAAPAFQVSSPVIESPSATQTNSPIISDTNTTSNTSDANATQKPVVTPEVSAQKAATQEAVGSPKIATSDANVSPKTVVAEAVSSPKVVAAPSTPVQVKVEAPTPSSAPESPAATTEIEEATVATPMTEADAEIEDLVATSSPTADLDADLNEEEATDAEVNEDIAGNNGEVEETKTTETETAELPTAEESIVEAKIEEAELGVVTGVKRTLEEDEDVSSPQSPTKKIHVEE